MVGRYRLIDRDYQGQLSRRLRSRVLMHAYATRGLGFLVCCAIISRQLGQGRQLSGGSPLFMINHRSSLKDWINWMEIPLYMCSIIFTVIFATPCLCVYDWQWQIGVVSIFLAWMVLITFLQKWPLTGIYVLMFLNILGSFLSIIFLALLLVIAFALVFYMLLFEPDEMVMLL